MRHTSREKLGGAFHFRRRSVVAQNSLELFSPDDLHTDSSSFAPFLNRARAEREQGRDSAARIALGAYLGARLVDRCLTASNSPDDQEGFDWQLESTRKFLQDLPGDEPEVSHLLGISEAVNSETTHRDDVLRMALVAYAYYLEHEARLEEALEVLALSARTYRASMPLVDTATISLFVARLNRMLARWERANKAYSMAETAGLEVRDLSTVMLARIGLANVNRGQGNLPAARSELEKVVTETDSPELAEVRGRALSDLSVVLERQGLLQDAITTRYRALLCLRDEVQRTRVLGDLGIILRTLGAYDAARLSFDLVLSSDTSLVIRANACLELMELESAVANRIAFERYRQEARTYEDRMPPSMAIDYRYKIGIGFARFGKELKARAALREALSLAEANQLNEWYFRVDRVLRGLELCQDHPDLKPMPAQATEMAPAVAKVSAGLLELAGVSEK
jgi:tetratricopeptide (TPR) repeat protein